jgi:hypothetical protein
MSAVYKFFKTDVGFFLIWAIILICGNMVFGFRDEHDLTRVYVFAGLLTVLRRLDRLEAGQ